MTKFGTYLVHGFRSLLRKPSFLIVSVIVLGISLGNQIAVSSLAEALLVAPPTAAHPEELVFVGAAATNGQVSHPDLLDLQERNTVFSGTFGYASYRGAGIVSGDQFVTSACTAVSGTFFNTLGIRPGEGRLFRPEDDRPAAAPVAILTPAMAAQLHATIGSLIKVNNVPFTVVGILPPDFRPIDRGRIAGVWLPLTKVTPFRLPQFLTNRGFQWVRFGGRLKPGQTLESANAELKVLSAVLKKENPTVNFGMDLFAQRYVASRLAEGGNARTIVLLYGIAWLLSGLAFVNFAALAVLRLLGRRREIIIRTSVGASRADLVWPLLVELLSVCLVAVAAGIGFSYVLFTLFKLDPALAPVVGALDSGITFGSVSSVAAAVLACAVLVWGLALRFTGYANLALAAREGSAAPHRQWANLGLYALQFAIVFCLVFIAVTIIRELRAIEGRQLPFRTSNVLLAEINPNIIGLASNRQAKEEFIERCLQAIRAAPGVIAAGGHVAPPLVTSGSTNLILNGEDPTLVYDKNFAHYGPATSGFFEALGSRLIAGRTFTDADFAANARVVVVNHAAARRFWPEGAIDRQFKPWPGNSTVTIIGVVDDIPRSNAPTTPPEIFLPYRLVSSTSSLTFAIHVQEDTLNVRTGIQNALKAIWPDVSVPRVYPIADQVEKSRLDVRMAVRIALVIAGIAAVVVGFGLYFFSAYTAAQLLRQSAIRLAIGASPGRVVWEHLRRYRWALLAGTFLGCALLRAAVALSDLVAIKSGAAAVESGAVTFAFVTMIALIGLCLPLRALYRLQVYRVLSQAD